MSLRYLTPNLQKTLGNKKTQHGVTLQYMIKSGIDIPDSRIGIYVGDGESYKVFEPLLPKIIEEHHNVNRKTLIHKTNWNSSDIVHTNLDPENKYIQSTRIRVTRNLSNLPSTSKISLVERQLIMEVMGSALSAMDSTLLGTFKPINSLSDEEFQDLVSRHILFKKGDHYLECAGICRDWPNGRGLFTS